MNFTLRQLKIFVSVFELTSFSAAAKAMHMTQSAVSKLCIELEQQVGAPLFDRSTRRVTPTSEAEDLYGYACELLGIYESAKRSMSGLMELERGSIRIAASPMMMYCILAPTIGQFRREHPGIKFELHELSTVDTIAKVIDGSMDFGVVSIDKPDPKLVVEPLCESGMYAILPQGHPLTKHQFISWSMVTEYEHISMRPVFSIRSTIDLIVGQQNLSILSDIETGTVMSSLAMVDAGLGLAVLPGYVTALAQKLGLVTIPLDGVDITHRLSLIRRRNTRPTIASNAFLKAMKENIKH